MRSTSKVAQNDASCDDLGGQVGLIPLGDPPSANVLGVRVEALTMDQALAKISRILCSGKKGYVCAIGVHGVMEAQRDPELAAAFAEAAITIPDGMPMAWVGRLQGYRSMQRVAGPDLMREVFLRSEFAGYRHFFYGGKEGVAKELAASFKRIAPLARIVGTHTPPYRDLTKEEERVLIATINKLKPDMIWVGIGTPKQDKFMRHYLPMLDTGMIFGVGAAFDFHTGRIKDSAEWIKRAGLQWLHRLAQDPKRLWWRYFRSNPAFLWQIALQLSGLRRYTPSTARDGVSLRSRRPGSHLLRKAIPVDVDVEVAFHLPDQ
jgi:N-acetylglucosaminyldiphosphoundecaprenol N-acetyl-beta-D-mannosaminyltransferase